MSVVPSESPPEAGPGHLARLATAFLAMSEEEQHAACVSQCFSEHGMGPALRELARGDWGLAGRNDSEKADAICHAVSVAYGPMALGEGTPEQLARLLRTESRAPERARGLVHAAWAIRYRRHARQAALERMRTAAARFRARRAPHRLRARAGRRTTRRTTTAPPAAADGEPWPAARCAQPARSRPEALYPAARTAPRTGRVHALTRPPGRFTRSRPSRRALLAQPRLSRGPPKTVRPGGAAPCSRAAPGSSHSEHRARPFAANEEPSKSGAGVGRSPDGQNTT